MKKIICLPTIAIFASLFICLSDLNADSGEELFQSKCGKCHGSGGEAPAFSPVKYAASQWERFFERNMHGRKKDISQEVSADNLEKIKQYLVDHAADSDLPIAAGTK